jgi:outer membrane protein TolC
MMRRWLPALLLLAHTGAPLLAQVPDSAGVARPAPTSVLTLQDALTQGRGNNPVYRAVLNDEDPARWAVRNAYGQFLPTADASAGMSYTGEGSSTFGGSAFNQISPSVGSNYSLSLGWRLSGATIAGPGREKANQRATAADIDDADNTLRASITEQYLDALAAMAQTDASRVQTQRNQVFLDLAQARFQVGQATLIDVRQAEVQRGNSQIDLLRAEQAEVDAKLELFRRMGIPAPDDVELVGLVNEFVVEEPAFTLDTLVSLAEEDNPQLRALRARDDASKWNLRAARSAYLPTLSAQAGWSGFTQEFTDEGLLVNNAVASGQVNAFNCQFQNDVITRLTSPMPYPNGGVIPDCNAISGLNSSGTALDPAFQSAMLDANDQFPWDFQTQPFQAQLVVSLPLFTGFGRQLDVARASAARKDAEEAVREQALFLRTGIQSRLRAYETAYEAIGVQSANRDAARDQLRLAQDRYRLGSGTSLELSDAQNAVQRAESDYINAVYLYHRALVALEAAVGRPLR